MSFQIDQTSNKIVHKISITLHRKKPYKVSLLKECDFCGLKCLFPSSVVEGILYYWLFELMV